MPEQIKELCEKRSFTGVVEIREDGDKKPKIEGYAAMFNQETVIGGMFREVIRPGFFQPAIAEKHDVRAVIDHEGGILTLGRTKNGTLTLSEDEKGLRVSIDPPDTQAARDALTLLKRGDLDQMSFMFTIKEQKWTDGEDGELDLRELLKVKRLYDASIVTYPAYEGTSVGVRSAEQVLAEERPARGFKPGPMISLVDVTEAETE